jgi:hypothetical protein
MTISLQQQERDNAMTRALLVNQVERALARVTLLSAQQQAQRSHIAEKPGRGRQEAVALSSLTVATSHLLQIAKAEAADLQRSIDQIDSQSIEDAAP